MSKNFCLWLPTLPVPAGWVVVEDAEIPTLRGLTRFWIDSLIQSPGIVIVRENVREELLATAA